MPFLVSGSWEESSHTNSVLLCPGPSVAAYVPHPDALVVGVNRAAQRIACDAWICGDPPAIQQFNADVIGSPLLVTSTDGKHQYGAFPRDFGHPLWRGECLCWTEMFSYCPNELAINWQMLTATAALVYCGFRGATTIDVYGADWSGVKDWDGVAAGKNRSEARWVMERGIWANVTNWLNARGVEVIRHQPAA